ncbi:MAG: rod shape-determining protein MreC [Betaproteobacteria bacterium HGW-Betaproteobacteria-22]|nr:MAG: rod shape-determining protein MreC [Betaproteobacteria bacterium HGW-Betaproteobacteria-22]
MFNSPQNFEPQQAPAFFARGPSPLARLAFFSALSLVLMATDSRIQYLATARANLMVLLHPLQVVANTPSQLYHFTSNYFTTHHHLLNDNQQLKQQALTQKIAMQRLASLELENAHLRNLLSASQALAEVSKLAEIMRVGNDPFTKKIIVNRGSIHEIITGAAVVDADGVIGQITRVYPSSSEITLITDKSLTIPIQIERNGLRAIAFGNGKDNTLNLPFLPANVDIKQGDKLVTSGIDGVYPAGLAVAIVKEIKINSDSPFARIVCTPAGGIENHRQVLIVNLAKGEELQVSPKNSLPADKTKKNKSQTTRTSKPDSSTLSAKKPNARN